MSNNRKPNPWDDEPQTTAKQVQRDPNKSNDSQEKITAHQRSQQHTTQEQPNFTTHQSTAKRPSTPNALNISPVIVIVLLLMGWLSTGIYRVATHEKAAVFYLGKFAYIADPGLHYRAPFPIAYVIKRGVSTINKEEFSTNSPQVTLQRSSQNYITNTKDAWKNKGSDTLMLTGDENIVDIDFEVQWRIADLRAYLLNLEGPAATLRESSISAMREVIGTTPISEALSSGKADIEERTKTLLQGIMDQYQSGIEIILIQLLRVDPPQQVINSFRDIQTAKADKESSINEAEAYYNDVVPKARGEAEQIIQEAEAYKQRTIVEAEGKTNRFLKIYQEYLHNKQLAIDQIYLETMEKVFRNSSITIMDDSSSRNLLPHLSVKPTPSLKNQGSR